MKFKEFKKIAEKIGVGGACIVSIEGTKISKAHLQKKDGDWYVCQDKREGKDCKDKLGHRFSWVVSNEITGDQIDYIKPIESEVKNMRKLFQLLKETDSHKKGAIVEEMCDDGTQNFVLLDKKFEKFEPERGYEVERACVVNNPKWWQEVVPMYVTKEEEKKIKKILKK